MDAEMGMLGDVALLGASWSHAKGYHQNSH